MTAMRTRWAAIGAAVAVTLGAGGLGLVSAATTPEGAAAFVPIEPCRVADTRTDFNVGPRAIPLGADETHTIAAHGDNGNCTDIPSTARGLVLNVTALGATAPTFLAVWAAGGDRPVVSSLNPAPGQPPTPNAVSTQLSATGAFSIYNKAGLVDLIVDINGFYTDHGHDDRYPTDAEVDAKIAAAALAGPGDTDVFDRTIVVNGGGTPAENGVALSAAIDQVSSSSPTAVDPWAIFVEPGVFELPSAVNVPDHVTITGSGIEATTIETPASTAFEPMMNFGVGELREIEVIGRGLGFVVSASESLRVDSARIRFAAATLSNNVAALKLDNGQHAIVDSEIVVEAVSNGVGIRSTDADVTVRGTTLTSLSGGSVELIYMTGGDVVVDRSTIEGEATGIFSCCNRSDGTLTVRNSVIDVSRLVILANFRPLAVEVDSSSLLGVSLDDVVEFNAAGTFTMRGSTLVGGTVGGSDPATETCRGTTTGSGFLSSTCP